VKIDAQCFEKQMPGIARGLLKEGTYDCKAAAANAIGEMANASDRRVMAIERLMARYL